MGGFVGDAVFRPQLSIRQGEMSLPLMTKSSVPLAHLSPAASPLNDDCVLDVPKDTTE